MSSFGLIEENIELSCIHLAVPKLFWPTVRKKCSSDREKLLICEAEGREFTKKN